MKIAIPDNIMSDITTKELLEKWVSLILSNALVSLRKYYLKEGNCDVGDKNCIVAFFQELNDKISVLTPVLEDLVDKNICGIEDVFISIFGVSSDAVYALREYTRLAKDIDSWDEDFMWNDCDSDKRLKNILFRGPLG